MSTDDSTKGIENLRDTGQLSAAAAREAIRHPIEAEKIMRLDSLEKNADWQTQKLNRFELALYGDEHLDPPGNTPGIMKDLGQLKIIIFQAQQSILTVVWVGGLVGTIIGLALLYVSAMKK